MSNELTTLQDYYDLETGDMDEESLNAFFKIDCRGFHEMANRNTGDLIMNRTIKYMTIYGPLVIFHCSKGLSFQSFAGCVGVLPKTVDDWIEKYPEFAACVEIAQSRLRLEWDKIILKSAKGHSKGNAASIIFALKNYFPKHFKDKQDETKGGLTIIVDTGIKRKARVVDGQDGIVEAEVIQPKQVDFMDRRGPKVVSDEDLL